MFLAIMMGGDMLYPERREYGCQEIHPTMHVNLSSSSAASQLQSTTISSLTTANMSEAPIGKFDKDGIPWMFTDLPVHSPRRRNWFPESWIRSNSMRRQLEQDTPGT